MYKPHFGLARYPFEPSIAADELFPGRAQAEAEARIRHLVDLRGIGLLTGEPGSGKSTVCRKAVGRLHGGRFAVRYVSLTTGSVTDIYGAIAHAFGLEPGQRRARAFGALRAEVSRLVREAGKLPVLVVDEAHHLRNPLLEELRLLTNYEMDSENRLCLLLVGQTGLRRRLGMAVHESLRQRLVVRCQLGGLERDEVDGYLRHRLRLAGVATQLFDENAVEAVALAGAGLPRRIDRIAHLSLHAAALGKRRSVSAEDVETAAKEAG